MTRTSCLAASTGTRHTLRSGPIAELYHRAQHVRAMVFLRCRTYDSGMANYVARPTTDAVPPMKGTIPVVGVDNAAAALLTAKMAGEAQLTERAPTISATTKHTRGP